jgi:hypothetical protein
MICGARTLVAAILATTLLLGTGITLLWTQPVWAAFPGANGKIAFESWDGDWEIFVMNADGSGVTQLTYNQAHEHMPAWSPDGSSIAFEGDRGGNAEILVMNADGSRQIQLTDNPADDNHPAWSPDGSKIAFSSTRSGDREIFVMNADGSEVRQLTNNQWDDAYPAWSPDGSKITFSSYRDGQWDLFVMDADSSQEVQLTKNSAVEWMSDWSPDGSKIVFDSDQDGDSEIFVMNADGSGQIQLTRNNALDLAPAWSPDGSKIAFQSNRDGDMEIFVMNADGSRQVRLGSLGAGSADWQPIVAPNTQGTSVVNDEVLDVVDNNHLGIQAPPYVDLVKVKISQLSMSQLEFRIEVDGDFPGFEETHIVKYSWGLDTDRNKMTSFAPVGFLSEYIGVDCLVGVSYNAEWNNVRGDWVASISFGDQPIILPRSSLTVSGRTIIVTITLAQLRNPTSFDWDSSVMDYWVDSNQFSRKDKPVYWDVAPSKGYGTLFISPSIRTTQTPPSLEISVDQVSGLSVRINGVTLPGTPGTTGTRVNWNWGDGTIEDHYFPATHLYSSSGTYTITVTSLQSDGLSTRKSLTVTVGQTPLTTPRPPETVTMAQRPPEAIQTDSTLIAIAIVTAGAVIGVAIALRRRASRRPSSAAEIVDTAQGKTASQTPRAETKPSGAAVGAPKPVLPTQERDARYIEYLARLEDLRARGEISEETFLKLKDEYWKKFKGES